jgi:mono/diheme cytochrome c family protein
MRTQIMAAGALAILALACGGDTPTPESHPAGGPSEPAIAAQMDIVPFALTDRQERGKEIYESACWSCHGAAGRGDGPAVLSGSVSLPPNLLNEAYKRMGVQDLERRFETQLEGGEATHPHMQTVTSFVGVDGFRDALAYVAALVYPPEIPGSALRGRETYEFRCAVCHGPEGRGDGSATEFLGDIPPADFTADTLIAARNFTAVFNRIKEGGRMHQSYMPAWGVMFSDGEIWDLVAYVSALQRGILAPPPSDGTDG